MELAYTLVYVSDVAKIIDLPGQNWREVYTSEATSQKLLQQLNYNLSQGIPTSWS